MKLWMRLRLSRQPDGTSLWWGISILLAGIVLVLLGWLWEGTWEDVFIEVGAAAGVGGIVLLFKPRLMRQVDERATEAATTTAEAVTTSKTEALEGRLVRLESISNIQADEQYRQQEDAQQVISAVHEAASFDTINNLLNGATTLGLFKNGILVKTSTDLGQPLLHVSRYSYVERPGEPRQTTIYLSVIPLMVVQTRQWFASSAGAAVSWFETDSTQDMIRKTIQAYVRLNLPSDKLSIESIFVQLRDSYSLMVEARGEPAGSGKRLNGRLIIRLNEEWALTDKGLERTQHDQHYAWDYHHELDCFYLAFTVGTPCPDNCDESLWEEAWYYATRLSFDDEWNVIE